MSSPYFSIVIPTKNRAFLLGHNLRSLLKQTFTDFEVIVADNDDTDATVRVVKSFADPRVRHLRTGGKSMPDNWEAGAQAARGRYLCMLEDKQALKWWALERLHEEAIRHQPQVMNWPFDKFEDATQPVRLLLVKPESTASRFVPSDELIGRFCRDRTANYKDVLPLPQLSAIHRDVIGAICTGPMKRLFHPVSPDVVLSLLLLNYADEVLQVPVALGVYSSTFHSNGRSGNAGGQLFQQFLRELGFDESRLFDKVPLKAINYTGSLFNDFLHVKERVGGRLANYEICWLKFFVESQRVIWGNAKLGVDTTGQQAAWDAAFAKQSEEVRSATLEALPRKPGTAAKKSFWQDLSRSIGLNRVERQVKGFVRGRLRGDLEWRFRNADEYLEWEGTQPRPDQG